MHISIVIILHAITPNLFLFIDLDHHGEHPAHTLDGVGATLAVQLLVRPEESGEEEVDARKHE